MRRARADAQVCGRPEDVVRDSCVDGCHLNCDRHQQRGRDWHRGGVRPLVPQNGTHAFIVGQIAAIESGSRRVDLEDLPRLCGALQVTPADLLAGNDREARPSGRPLPSNRAAFPGDCRRGTPTGGAGPTLRATNWPTPKQQTLVLLKADSRDKLKETVTVRHRVAVAGSRTRQPRSMRAMSKP
jgi:transcriptional regulator with XRE-family HTH domain